MSWSLVIAVLLGAPTVAPCAGAVYGGSHRPNPGFPSRAESGAITSDSAASGDVLGVGMGFSSAAGHEGEGAEDLRRFASTRVMKTGTTIAGVVFEGGVVLGADTRATGGKTVCDRNCDKIHVLASNIACCGAGTSADAVKITEGARLALLRMAGEMQACLPSSKFPLLPLPPQTTEGTDSANGLPFATRDSDLDVVQRQHLRVAAAASLLKRHLFRYQGIVSAALVLGGVDAVGEHIYQIHEGGSFAEVEFTAMGSGSLAALSVLERGHRDNLTEGEAKELVLQAIAAGIDNDLGSGSNIDLCVITAERGLEHHRGAWKDPGLGGGDDAGVHLAQELENGRRRQLKREQQQQQQQQVEAELLDPHVDIAKEVGGEGGSRAWVGNVRRRNRGKSVVRVDHEGSGDLRTFRSSALDDQVEVL